MKKRKHTLWMLLFVLVVLIVAYAGVRTGLSKKEAKKEAANEANKVYVTDVSDVSGFSYTNGTVTMNFKKENASWIYQEDKTCPIAQDAVQEMIDTFSKIPAERELKKPDGLAGYGLENPSYEVHLTTADGTTDVYIGNPSGDSYYYGTTGDKRIVYTMDAATVEALIFDIKNLLAVDEFPQFSEDNLTKVVVTKGKTVNTYTGDDEKLNSIASGLSTFAFTACEDYNVNEKKLKSYGLDQNSRTKVELTYKDSESREQTAVLYVGNMDSTGDSRYAQLEGSANVDTMSADAAKTIVSE